MSAGWNTLICLQWEYQRVDGDNELGVPGQLSHIEHSTESHGRYCKERVRSIVVVWNQSPCATEDM